MGRDAVRWQDVTTLRAPAREAEQRSQRAVARLNRVRSALTQEVRVVMGTNLSVHAASPVEESGQLPFLGSCGFLQRERLQVDLPQALAFEPVALQQVAQYFAAVSA